MKLVQTFDGLEATLKPPRLQRFTGAAFLTVWLTFWAFGEVFVIWILALGGWSLFTGQPPGPGRSPLQTGPALAMGLFLLCWLAFWTFGGVMAGREWLRLMFGRDRLVVRPEGVEINRGFGLFTKRQFFPRESVLRFYRPPPGSVLKLETPEGVREITRFGSAETLGELETALNTIFDRPPPPSETGLLPDDWRELNTPEGSTVVAADPATRRKQAWVVGVVFLLFALVAFFLFEEMRTRPSLGALFAIVFASALALGWATYTLFRTRNEWKVERGSLVLQRRSGLLVTTKFTATALKLTESRESDGDAWYRLVAVAADAPATLAPGKNKFERVIYSSSDDPVDARKFGVWLARRTSLALTDLATPEARSQEIIELTRQLAASGRFGKWAARALDRARPPTS